MVVGQQGADVIDVRMALRAFTDSQYQSTAYAIAELIDNSIDAEASAVDVLFREQTEAGAQRARTSVTAVAVVDNGTGMSLPTLRDALMFGGRGQDVEGHLIGKYGVGLPTSSVTQCRRVDVWTWQESIESALHCSLDVGEIESGAKQLPFPTPSDPPAEWVREARAEIVQARSGTLVLWTNLRRLDYRRSQTIMNHVERGVGRIHRRFIGQRDIDQPGGVVIMMKSFGGSQPHVRPLRPNDPMYLMEQTTTPEPWNEQPMFQRWGETKIFKVECDGASFDVEVVYSIAKDDALRVDSFTDRAGRKPHGRDAAENAGISVVREDRELVMLPPVFGRVGRESEINRWWGCEVRFPSGCDDLFGVDHNKQMAAHFRNVLEEFARMEEDASQQMADDAVDGDEWRGLYDLAADIRNVTGQMRRHIETRIGQLRPPRPSLGGGPTTPEEVAEDIADAGDKEAQNQGTRPETDADRERNSVPAEERESGHRAMLEELGYGSEGARAEAERMVRNDARFKFVSRQVPGSLMFEVNTRYGVHYVTLNLNHPMYDLLREIEDKAIQDADEALSGACIALRLLFTSWAAAEDQYPDPDQRRRVQDIAWQWGRQAEVTFQAERNRREGG